MVKNIIEEIYPYLTEKIISEMQKININDSNLFNNVCEIRIRNNLNLIIKLFDSDILCEYIVTKFDIEKIIEKLSNYSIYSIQNEINNGYITIKGGHRIGICGTTIISNNEIINVKDISSINIRIARQVIGCSDRIFQKLYRNGFKSTLIVSPPNCGKTTLIRDLIRNISDNGQTVSVIDERSEVACVVNGYPQMNIGKRTDVINKVLKCVGMRMAIRSMGPDVIAVDEIGNNNDISALKDALISGVKILVSAHGGSFNELKQSNINQLLKMNVIKYVILLKKDNLPGVIDNILEINEGGEKCIF